MRIKQWVIGLFGVCVLWGTAVQAQTAAIAQNPVAESAQPQGHRTEGLAQISPSQVGIVVYSQPEVPAQGVLSVFVNGTYHSALGKGAFSDFCFTPGKVELSIRRPRPGQPIEAKPDSVATVEMTGGQTYYLRVREQAGIPELQVVPYEEAIKEISVKRQPAATLSRVAQLCLKVDQTI